MCVCGFTHACVSVRQSWSLSIPKGEPEHLFVMVTSMSSIEEVVMDVFFGDVEEAVAVLDLFAR